MSDRLDQLDYYTLFRIEDEASADQIRDAYHNFALKYHPDRYAGAPAEKKARAAQIFRRGAEGYRVLMDPEMRRRYDEGLSKGQMRLNAEEQAAPSQRPRPSGVLSVRSPKARPFAKKALRDVKRGDYKSAKFQLKMALQHEPDSDLLQARLAEVEQRLAEQGRG